MGRRSDYTQELADTICDRLANGETLTKICEADGMPDFATVWRWELANEEFRKASLRAREVGTHKMADDCIAIADTPEEGVVDKLEMVAIGNPDDPDGEATTELQVTERKREDMLGHRRLRIDTRLRLIGQWNRKVYGPKADHTHDVGEGLAALIARSGLGEADKGQG